MHFKKHPASWCPTAVADIVSVSSEPSEDIGAEEGPHLESHLSVMGAPFMFKYIYFTDLY